jgi:RNA polymerase sigma-70 factor, ECF subfamily
MTVPMAGEVAVVASSPDLGSGDRELVCLEAIYRQHHGFVWRNARRLGCDPSSIDDVVHEVFLVVARRLHEFRGEAQIRSWLFAITYHVVRQLRRNRARYKRRLEAYGSSHGSEASSGEAAAQETGHQLRQILLKLSEPKRLVFIMAELEGMTSVEIADCLRMKTGTVDSRLRAARIELRSIIAREHARTRRFLP